MSSDLQLQTSQFLDFYITIEAKESGIMKDFS